MKYKLEIEANSYEEFIMKANKALNRVSKEPTFQSLMRSKINVKSFTFDFGAFTVSREGENE